MEVKVDVHTVRPSSPGVKVGAKLPNTAYGSWCTPDTSPIRRPLTQSTHEAKNQLREENRTSFQLQRVRLFPDEYDIISDEKAKYVEESARLDELQDELEALKKTKTCLDAAERPPPKEEKPEPKPEPEAPQSPVPPSPSRKCDLLVPIDPQGRLYISWLFLVTFCYSYNAWSIPLRATFPYQTPDNLPMWLTMDYFCDLIYILDVVFVKPKLMFLHEGFWVNDPVETRKNYMRMMQYKFDVVSLAPLDILYVFFGTKMVTLRLPRLLKLQTFWEFHQTMDRVLSSPYAVRIGKTLFYIFYLIHCNACAYYAMSDYIGLGSNGWVYDNQGNAYIRCFYFATKTATSIGKNPKPESTIEYLYMTVAWLMGVFVFALLIGQIRDIIATATRAKTEYRKKVDTCLRYLNRLNMPKVVQQRVACWFYYTWSQQRCFDEEKILDSLPLNMKLDVALAVHMSTLSKVQLFRDCSRSLLRDLVLQLKPMTFLPGDLVVRRGDVGHHMYIIKSGHCCVMSPDEKEVVATLKEGSVFGEISLLGIEGFRRRTATVRSRGYSNLFALSRMDLETALEHHKEAAEILRQRADDIIRENSTRNSKLNLAEEEAKAAAPSPSDDAGGGDGGGGGEVGSESVGGEGGGSGGGSQGSCNGRSGGGGRCGSVKRNNQSGGGKRGGKGKRGSQGGQSGHVVGGGGRGKARRLHSTQAPTCTCAKGGAAITMSKRQLPTITEVSSNSSISDDQITVLEMSKSTETLRADSRGSGGTLREDHGPPYPDIPIIVVTTPPDK